MMMTLNVHHMDDDEMILNDDSVVDVVVMDAALYDVVDVVYVDDQHYDEMHVDDVLFVPGFGQLVNNLNDNHNDGVNSFDDSLDGYVVMI